MVRPLSEISGVETPTANRICNREARFQSVDKRVVASAAAWGCDGSVQCGLQAKINGVATGMAAQAKLQSKPLTLLRA